MKFRRREYDEPRSRGTVASTRAFIASEPRGPHRWESECHTPTLDKSAPAPEFGESTDRPVGGVGHAETARGLPVIDGGDGFLAVDVETKESLVDPALPSPY